MTFRFKQVMVAGACAALMSAYGVVLAETTTDTVALEDKTTAGDVLANIPVGPADENEHTSAAITRILVQCANTYASTDAMVGRGNYIYVSKDEDQETSYISAKLSLNYLRPNKMSVVSESEDDYLDCAFYANGTTSTHISTNENAYVTLNQPESLAAYAENYRAGELYDEYSGALALSVTGPVLISEDPEAWLFADVSRFIYEGKEDVNGAPCHRVRFIQHKPDMIVIIWVNEKTWLIDKTSFINSYDEDYEMVESFEEGYAATMSIMTWESQTTSPKAVKESAFQSKIPKGFEQRKDVKPAKGADDDGGGFWGSLVGLAAESSSEETTWSLTRVTGSLDLKLERFAKVRSPLVEFDIMPKAAGHEPRMAVVSEDGTANYLRGDGSVESTVQLDGPLGLVTMVTTETSDTLIVATDKTNRVVTAFDLQGKQLWSYKHPFTEVEQLVADMEPGHGIYVGLSGDSGIRKLNTKGAVTYATTKVYPQSLLVMPYEANRIAGRSSGDVYLLNRDLKLLETFDTEEWVGGIRWDKRNTAYPLVCLSYTTDRDVLLQRRSEKGEIAWTTIVEPKAEEISGSGFLWANLPVNGGVERCGVLLMSDGNIVIVTDEGSTLYRGKVSANAALVKRNNDSVVLRLTIADMNADGVDEIYTLMHDNLMQMQVLERNGG